MTLRACGCRTSDRGEPTTYCAELRTLQARYRHAIERYQNTLPDTEDGNAARDRLRQINQRISAHWRRK